MKTHEFKITLTFADNVKGEEAIREMVEKIADALKHECESGNGLAPESSETYTEEIEVIHTKTKTRETSYP
ncbi:MAG TPA: hypothetical protein VMX17_17450 [Candidatus Glassbacteria bacterium]|nr:hypothetical protein [Candidatus Glassbacteria bacterium]